MKNIFFSLLILSSSLIYSTDFKVNVTKNEDLAPSRTQKISYQSQDEEEMDLEDWEEEAFLNNMMTNERPPANGWKIIKGLAGLWAGTQFFFGGSKGTLLLLMCPDNVLSETILGSCKTLSPVEKFLTNRVLWISLCGTLTVFSLWLLKKSADNLYQGLYATEDTIDAIF